MWLNNFSLSLPLHHQPPPPPPDPSSCRHYDRHRRLPPPSLPLLQAHRPLHHLLRRLLPPPLRHQLLLSPRRRQLQHHLLRHTLAAVRNPIAVKLMDCTTTSQQGEREFSDARSAFPDSAAGADAVEGDAKVGASGVESHGDGGWKPWCWVECAVQCLGGGRKKGTKPS